MTETPRTDAVDIDDAAINYKRLCRQLERELAEAHRVIAWLRSGGHNRFNHTAEGIRPESVCAHLASSPPVEWRPPQDNSGGAR